MKEKQDLICPRCGEFLGSAKNLDECPICGKEFCDETEEE